MPTYRPEILSFDGELPPVVHVLPNDDANKETRTITNVAAGRISATSTDAVNGSQLYAVIDSLSSITASSGRRGEKGEQGLQGLKGDKGDPALVDVKVGKNISVKEENHPNGYRSFTISTADNVSFNSVKVNNLEINQAGINAGSQRIAQVVDGINDTDVVNVRQLKQVKNYVEETAQEIRNVKGQLNQMNQELRAGIAGASALGMLQASSGAESALSASLANYKGQSAVAVGYARSSDNNQVHIKLGSGINTASDVTLGGV
ncbi:YadA-like family protein [Mannheimia pernigra]|uniref:YadA-like family protein n=1 Tax=Mannheimia pernigra TaxID=111844 RepID=UPI001316A463|nr:YadA-like family protein [Mannheimia pernigra]QHB17378.1 hypothetical protein GM695_04695 [Mannheimia pernigra]